MIISAFTVETEPRGFVACSWPATSVRQAEAMAKQLSEKHATNPSLPNAFWVIGSSNKPLCKFLRGERFAPSHVI